MSEERSESGWGDDSTTREGSRLAFDRRSYLKLGAAAAAAGPAAFAASENVSGASETRHGVSFGTVVDAVDDLGMDDSGNDPIDDALDDAAGSDTLIKFPSGQYLVTRQHAYDNISNFGIVGTGSGRGDVEFVFPSGYDDKFLNVRFGENWVFEDFTMQQTDDRETGVGCSFGVDDNLHLENVEIAGFSPRNKQRGLSVVAYGGEATLKRYVRRDNSAIGNYPSGTQALLVSENHTGTIYLKDLDIRNAGENGVYASRAQGDVRIEGGYFENNDIASVRVAGEGSYVKGATFVVDTDSASGNEGSYDNARALWVEDGSKGYTGGYVEDCDFVLKSADNSGGLIRVSGTTGDWTVRNCRLRNETRFATLLAKSGPGSVTVENTSITAESDNQRRGALEIVGRNGSTVSDCCVAATGNDYDGLVIRNSSNCTVRRSDIDVSGEPIVADNSSVATSSISNDGSCPLPSESGGGTTSGPNDGSDSDSDSTSDSDGDSEQTTEEQTTEESSSEEQTTEESTEEQTTEESSSEETATEESAEEQTTEQTTEESSSEETATETETGTASGDVENGSDDTETTEETETPQETETTETATEESQSTAESDGDAASSSTPTTESGSGDEELSRTLSLRSDAVAPYRIEVSGDIAFDPSFGTEDRINGNVAKGVLAGGRDVYHFSGEIVGFEIEDASAVAILLDGDRVEASDVGGSSGGSQQTTETPQETETETTETPQETETETPQESQSTPDSDSESTSEQTANASTENASAGNASSEGASGDGMEDVEPEDGESEGEAASSAPSPIDGRLVNAISIESDGAAPYHIEVGGDIAFDPRYGSEDSVDDAEAEGILAGGRDVYRFSGEITAFEIDGPATIHVNGHEVDADEVVGMGVSGEASGEHAGETRTLELNGTGDPAPYQFEVSEAVERGRNTRDIVEGTYVRGHLFGGRDVYHVTGDILWFSIDGDAEITLDGERVSPDEVA